MRVRVAILAFCLMMSCGRETADGDMQMSESDMTEPVDARGLDRGDMRAAESEMTGRVECSDFDVDSCENAAGCTWRGNGDHAFYRDGACVDGPGLCVEGAPVNNGINTCRFRETEDGVEVLHWSAGGGFEEGGWRSEFENLPEACACLEIFAPN